MDKTLAGLIFALTVNELVHNLVEAWSIRQKVRWLQARMDNQPHGDWPMHVDTRPKTYLLHTSLLVIIGGSAYLLARLLDISAGVLLTSSLILLLISYVLTTHYIDAYHRDIGALLKRYKRL